MSVRKHYSVRWLTFMVVGVSMSFLIVAFGYLFWDNMSKMLLANEKDRLVQLGRIASNTLDSSVKSMPAITRDWSSWDDTYAFMRGENPEFITKQLDEYPFLLHNLNLIVMLDADGKPVHAQSFSEQEKQFNDLSPDFVNLLAKLAPLAKQTYTEKSDIALDKELGRSGFIEYNNECYYISVLPIVNSDETSDVAGTFVFGRLIDKAEIERIIASEELEFSLLSIKDNSISTVFTGFSEEQSIIYNDNDITLYKKHKDFFAEQSLVIRVPMTRTLYHEGLSVVTFMTVVMTLAFLAFTIVVFLMLESVLLKPIKRLTTSVGSINKDTKMISEQGYKTKELFHLASSINQMLTRLILSRKKLEQSNLSLRIYREAISSAMDEVIIYSADGVVEYANPAALSNMGYAEDEFIGKRNVDFLDNGDLTCSLEEIWQGLQAGEPWQGEIYARQSDGSLVINEMTLTPIVDEDGHLYRVTAIKRDIAEKKEQERNLTQLALYDSLTGLPNRYFFASELDKTIGEREEKRQKAAVFFIDVDNFKLINDSMGHKVGDKVLCEVAKRIKKELPDVFVARMGGDEFTLLIKDFRDRQELEEKAYYLLKLFEKPLLVNESEFKVSISIGVSIYPDDGDTAEILQKNADTAMFKAKDKGRSFFVFYSAELDKAVLRRVYLEQQMRAGFARGEFFPYFQPKVYSANKKIHGFEALARWASSEDGLVMPMEFIPIAEETGLIVPLTEMILQKSCVINQRLLEQGYDSVVSVNVTANMLLHSNFLNVVKTALVKSGMPPEKLDIEITESCFISELEQTNQALLKLKQMGISISVDDFGTGYSSLSYLKKIHVDRIKIDRSFVNDIYSENEPVAIIDAIISMSKSLGLQITAEGVETKVQFDYLKARDCDEIQGYFVKPPMPEIELKSFIESWQVDS